MASRRPSSEATTYRDRSPASPRSPISPSALPQWLRPGRSRSTFFGHGKIKLAFVALACILLGWMVTSTLGPRDDHSSVEHRPDVYDPVSGGILGDPSGFGQKLHDEKLEAKVDGFDELEDDNDHSPSVSGALAELHHAVTDKIQSWNPYNGRPDKTSRNDTGSHRTQKRPPSSSAPVSLGEYIADGIPESERLGARTRVGKCTILFNGNSFWERAIKTHEEHYRLHGYRLHVLRQQLLDDVWSKPAYILSLLLRELGKPESERLDWLFWVDADTIILNPQIPIEVFLPPPGPEFEDVNLLYATDWNGLNNGVFPVRVCQWSVQLFSAIVAFRHYKPDEELIFRDQSAMDTIMHEPRFVRNIVHAPQRWFNAYQGEHNETLAPFQIRRGDLLVHFAGVPNREERMGYWLDRAEQHLEDWEVPLKSTSYPQERKDFWADQRDLRSNRKSSVAEARLKATQLLSTNDQQLNDYGDRLTEDERTAISKAREALNNLLGDEKYGDGIDKVNEMMTSLKAQAMPLTAAIANGQKILLNAAHEAIFGGEKDLMDGGFSRGVSTPELQRIHDAIQTLKGLVMAPQEDWQRVTITSATNAVTDARARWQQQTANAAAEQAKAAEAEDARKALQAQVNKEAAEAVGRNGGEAQDKDLEAPPAISAAMPAATLFEMKTVMGDPVVTTIIGEPVIETVMGEPIAVALWKTVQGQEPEPTMAADPDRN